MAKQRVEAMHFFWPALTAHIASAETYHCPAGLFLARPRNREWPFRTATQDCRCSHASSTLPHRSDSCSKENYSRRWPRRSFSSLDRLTRDDHNSADRRVFFGSRRWNRPLPHRGAAGCVAATPLGVRLNRVGKCGSRGSELFLLGGLDPALNGFPAAPPRRFLRKRNLSCCNPQK